MVYGSLGTDSLPRDRTRHCGACFGLPVESVSIEPGPDAAGCIVVPYPDGFDPDQDQNAAQIMEKHLIANMAGVKALEILTGLPTPPDDSSVNPRIVGTDWSFVTYLVLLAG